MNLFSFFLLLQKRLLKKKSVWFIFIIFAGCMLFLNKSSSETDSDKIRVGVCLETEDEFTRKVYNTLLSEEDSLFSFCPVSSADTLATMIENNSLECGYLFKKPLLTELNKKHLKRLVTVYISDNTSCKGILNEYVYSVLFKEYGKHISFDRIISRHKPVFSPDDPLAFSYPKLTFSALEDRYLQYFDDKELFSFDIRTVTGNQAQNGNTAELVESGTKPVLRPLFRGLIALFIMLGGFMALTMTLKDITNGLYDRLHGIRKQLAALLSMLSLLVPCAVVSALLLFVTANAVNPLRELFALAVYLAALLLFYGIFGQILRNPSLLCGAFPVLVLLTLLCCPIITDLSVFFPWMRSIRILLPANYYFLFF